MNDIQELKDFPNYGVTRGGEVYSFPREIWNGHGIVHSKLKRLKENTIENGYHQVILYRDKRRVCKLVHRLVAETFLENPNPQEYDQINHIDGNKDNNRLDNLEWCNNALNQVHAWANGLQPRHTNQWRNRKGVACAEVDEDGNIIKTYPHLRTAMLEIAGYVDGNLKASILRGGTYRGHKFILI